MYLKTGLESLRNSLTSARLSRRLALTVLLFSFLASLLITVVEFWRAQKQDLEKAETLLRLTSETAAVPLAGALWNFDVAAASLTVEGIARLPDVAGVMVQDQKATIVSMGTIPPGVPVIDFPLRHRVSPEQTESVGRLITAIDRDGVKQRAFTRFSGILATNLILLLFISGLVLLLMEREVMRHLRQVARFVVERSGANLDERLILPRGQDLLTGDELDQLVSGIGRMQNNLQHALEELREDILQREAAEDEIRRLNQDLEGRVLARTRELEESRLAAQQVLDLTASAHWASSVGDNVTASFNVTAFCCTAVWPACKVAASAYKPPT